MREIIAVSIDMHKGWYLDENFSSSSVMELRLVPAKDILLGSYKETSKNMKSYQLHGH